MKRLMLAAALAVSMPALAQDAEVAALSQRVAALDAAPQGLATAAYERLQARQAIGALAEARRSERDTARYVAERRVLIAETVARAENLQRDVDRLDRERSELLVEASRQDAARARAEAERLRREAQIQAEEAARLREQALAQEQEKLDVEAVLDGVADAQTAKLAAARDRQAALARQEAELVAGAKLPASRRDARGEVFTLAGDAFASGQATLTDAAARSVRAVGAYVQATPGARVRVEGHTDSQGAADANLKLSQRRADAVRDALAAAGVPRGSVQAAGRGAASPIAENTTAAGRARNRRVDIIIAPK